LSGRYLRTGGFRHLSAFTAGKFGFVELKNLTVARTILKCFNTFLAFFSSFFSSRRRAFKISNLGSFGSIETFDALVSKLAGVPFRGINLGTRSVSKRPEAQ
jgi:hypothetical protein